MKAHTADPPPRARPEIHRVVEEYVAELGSGEGKAALDAPLGPGAMALQLRRAGYTVSGVDLDLNQSAALPPAITRLRANLNERLPLPDASFLCRR